MVIPYINNVIRAKNDTAWILIICCHMDTEKSLSIVYHKSDSYLISDISIRKCYSIDNKLIKKFLYSTDINPLKSDTH